jgi:hypothetical protein
MQVKVHWAAWVPPVFCAAVFWLVFGLDLQDTQTGYIILMSAFAVGMVGGAIGFTITYGRMWTKFQKRDSKDLYLAIELVKRVKIHWAAWILPAFSIPVVLLIFALDLQDTAIGHAVLLFAITAGFTVGGIGIAITFGRMWMKFKELDNNDG